MPIIEVVQKGEWFYIWLEKDLDRLFPSAIMCINPYIWSESELEGAPIPKVGDKPLIREKDTLGATFARMMFCEELSYRGYTAIKFI